MSGIQSNPMIPYWSRSILAILRKFILSVEEWFKEPFKSGIARLASDVGKWSILSSTHPYELQKKRFRPNLHKNQPSRVGGFGQRRSRLGCPTLSKIILCVIYNTYNRNSQIFLPFGVLLQCGIWCTIPETTGQNSLLRANFLTLVFYMQCSASW